MGFIGSCNYEYISTIKHSEFPDSKNNFTLIFVWVVPHNLLHGNKTKCNIPTRRSFPSPEHEGAAHIEAFQLGGLGRWENAGDPMRKCRGCRDRLGVASGHPIHSYVQSIPQDEKKNCSAFLALSQAVSIYHLFHPIFFSSMVLKNSKSYPEHSVRRDLYPYSFDVVPPCSKMLHSPHSL